MATAQSRKAIAELVMLGLNGGSPTSPKFHIAEVLLQLDIVINQYISRQAAQDFKEGRYDQVDSMWVRQYYNIPIKYDKKIDMAYIKMPASRLGLPNDMDIRSISFMKGQMTPFVQNDLSSVSVIAQLDCYDTGENVYRYYMQNDKAFIVNGGSFLKGVNVLIKMIPSAGGYSPTDDLPINDAYVADIVENTKQALMLQQKTPHKETNDTNANTI